MNANFRKRVALPLVVVLGLGTTVAGTKPAVGSPFPETKAGGPGVLLRNGLDARQTERPFLSAAVSAEPSNTDLSSGNGHTTGLLLSGAGLIGGITLAVWIKNRADDRYHRYLHTADPDLARELRSSAERYDRATLIGWGLAQASFVGLIYFLTREDERTLVPVRGEPVIRPLARGIEVGFQLRP